MMNMKRLLSLILAFVMVLGMIPVPAFATEGEEISSVDVVLSLSADDRFMVGPGSGAIMAMKEISVPYFDLALYGLEEYYFVSESYSDDGDGKPGSDLQPGTPEYAYGKVTLLHLYIYALEVFYCGIDPDEAGQGYLYEEGLIGTEVFSISGGVGSSFMNQFWGGDCNLNYYVNYEYPLASEGWGATSDQILLRDGDIITLGHFTGWSFYADPYSIFNYITADNENPVQGEEITLTLYYAGADLGATGGTAQNLNTHCLDVYCASVDDIPSEDVTDWQYVGTADENGELVVDTAALEAGEYIFAVAGQPGDYTEEICSTPGGVRITVEAPAHTHNYEAAVTDPTCTEGGYTTYTCACGDSYTADETEALGHDFAEGFCSRCGEKDPDYVAPVEPVDTVIYTGSDWPFSYYYIASLTLTGPSVAYIEGTTVYLDSNTARNAEFTLTAAAGGRQSGNLGVNWNDEGVNTKTYTTNLVDGVATVKIYAYKASGAGVSRSGTKTFTFRIAEANEIPALASGVSAEVSETVTSGNAYVVDLGTIFTDADGDPLSYTVSVNGAAAVATDAAYSYLNTVPGTYVLKFTATDGKTAQDKQPTYTVTLTVKNSEITYDVHITAPEGVAPAFYAVNAVSGGAVVKGDALTYVDGVVKVPENITRIMWEADGLVGMSAPVSAGSALELVNVTFEATLDSGETDEQAAIVVSDSEGVSVSGTAADTYLLPALAGFTYRATASGSNAGKYNPGQLTDQTPTTGKVTIPLVLKHFTVIAPKGSIVSAGTLSGSFSYSFAEAIKVENVDDTVVYQFAPLSGNAFIRVQHPDDDAVTYWDYKSSKADGKTITVTEEMLFMNDAGTDGEFNADTVYRNFEYYSFDLGDIYMNINNQGYIDLDIGEVKALNMFRNWQAINSFTNDKIAIPDFEYEIVNIEGDNVISIVPDANNTGAATMTATGEGTAIVLVTYDAMYSEITATGSLGGAGGANRLSAIWPDRTGVFVVSVGKDGTGIQSNMTCNGAIFDAEHSPQFYHGDEGASVSFIPEEGVTVTVNRSTVGEKKLSFGEFTSEGVSVNAETGEVTVSGLTTGRHIIRLEKDGVAAYQVVTATQTTVTMTDSEGNALSLEEKLQPGQTVKLTVTGLTSPAEKFATKYNFNCQITYKDQFGNAYSNSSGATYGKYDFSSIPQVVTVTIPEDWTESTLTLNGFMKMGGFAGDGIGSHRKVSYGDNRGMAWGSDAGMELGTLPEIVLNVASAEHVHSYEAVVTAPTCTEGGYTTYTCECGESYIADETPALGHDYVDLICTRCGEALPIPSYPFTLKVDGQLVEVDYEGVNSTNCSMYGYTTHNAKITLPAGTESVTAEGVNALVKVYTSHNDRLTYTQVTPGAPKAVNIKNVESLCILDATNSVTYHVAIEFAACEHSWNDATCTTPKTCSKCGETEGEPLGHTEEIIPAVAPTCTETGLTEGKKCSVCGETLVAQEVVAALGHTEEVIPAVAPTCTETGLTEGKKCSICGETLVAQEVVAALGHTEEVLPAVAATCTETGLTEGKKCTVCGEITVQQQVVDALGHDFAEGTCTRCGEKDPDYVTVIATGWSGYTTWVLTSDGCLTFTSSGETLENGESNLKNYWKVNGVLTLPWGDYAESITKVVIEEGIHDIGQMAFYELPNLREVVLPASIVEIRNYAFKNCKSLTTINLYGVDFIREGAFYGCSALENVTFAKNVVIEDWAFSRTDITLP